MTVEELIVYGKKYIHTDLTKMLLANLLNLNALELLNHLGDVVSNELIDIYKKQVEAVRLKKPIQYVIGNVNFYGNIIDIDENVLIPRFETELLVEKTIQYIKKYFKEKVSIIDLGTGSGCIAITLKKELDASVDAVDISSTALEVAKKNAINNNVDINFILSDMLDSINNKYDVIISNPPYIAFDEEIMDIVYDNEPHEALFAPNEGIYSYEKILSSSVNRLKEKSLIAFEIGSTQGEKIKKIALKYYPDAIISIEKDLQGLDRFIFIFNNIM